MKIGIVGSGALGTLFGQRLAAANDVMLLDRKRDVVETIARDGVRVDGEARAAQATSESRDLYGVQVLFVFVRATDTLRALRPFAGELSPATAIVSLQNGLGNEEAIKTSLGGTISLVIGATTESALTVGPADVRRLGEGATVLGSAGASPELVNRVVRLLVDAGFHASAAYDIRPHLWGKLIANAAINPVAALLEAPNGVVLRDEHAGDVA
ncbi:MAG: 2-dehydropantoate 2-reductase, partial [Candidatus Eremiobacteraeota bacterium]|nr:2-dehydropantoate 2-reductase [Candidatus Eremiobacteraeota bacterium]